MGQILRFKARQLVSNYLTTVRFLAITPLTKNAKPNLSVRHGYDARSAGQLEIPWEWWQARRRKFSVLNRHVRRKPAHHFASSPFDEVNGSAPF